MIQLRRQICHVDPLLDMVCLIRVTFEGEKSMQLTLMDTSDETEGSKRGSFS